MRAVAVLLLLCATLFACEPAPEAASRPPDSPAATPAARTRFYRVRNFADLSPQAIDSIEHTKARAAGIVYSAFAGSVPGELTIINDTAHEVQTIARLRFYALPDGGFTDTLWTRRADLFSELERASHDDYGLQAESLHASWARVAYAYDSTGVAQQGWVRIVPGRVMYVGYDSLPQRR